MRLTRNRTTGILVVLLAVWLVGGTLATPGSGHIGGVTHTWKRHFKPLAKKAFYTKMTSDTRYINVGEVASDSALLDGIDSADFAGAIHSHAGDDITSGTVAEARIDAAIARVADVFSTVLAADGPGSGLDADLLDGQSSGAFASSSHNHAGGDITSGTVDEARIDALLTRDAEVFGIVTEADGSGSTLDADFLDGQSSGAFAASSHNHAGGDITSGTVAEARIDAAIARVADVFATVLAADGSGSTLDADFLDGQSSAAFQHASATPIQWFKESADSLATTATSERVVFVAPNAITITDVFIQPAVALAANNTNYATITVSRRNAGGGGKVTVASATTQVTGTGNWTAFTAVSLGSLSNTAFSDGQMITVEITKTALGVALPIMVVQVEYTVD